MYGVMPDLNEVSHTDLLAPLCAFNPQLSHFTLFCSCVLSGCRRRKFHEFLSVVSAFQDPGDVARDEGMPVDPNPDECVVNVGDMLPKLTSDEYKSSIHRVLNKNPTDCYSVVYFFDGNSDCPFGPLDGSSAGGEVLNVERHMIEGMTTTYDKGFRGKSLVTFSLCQAETVKNNEAN